MSEQKSDFGLMLNEEMYGKLYQQSINEPTIFWAEQAERFITWYQSWHTVSDSDFNQGKVNWFNGAKLNACYNCVDRHLPQYANRIAILWEGDNSQRRQAITYQMLYERVCRFANSLKSLGVAKGDSVCLYMPMIPDAVVAMLACARIGAVHTVVFGGFSPHALAERLQNAKCKVVITADEGVRAHKAIPLKKNVDEALTRVKVRKVIVIKNTGHSVPMQQQRDVWYHTLVRNQEFNCEPEAMDAEDPLFILYTSGSTGKPKGLVHTTGGYLLYAAITFRYVFDYKEQDIYWCTADIGWITGHSYGVYGPLANHATMVMYEGVITSPPNIAWEIIDRYNVSVFYTAPTAIRALMAFGDEPLNSTKRNSLRLLGTVGEPINPEAWQWYHDKVGFGRCWIVDTWWQTETGGIMIVPFAGIGKPKPGAACKPFFGIKPRVVDAQGNDVLPQQTGFLTITQSWPGQARTIYGNHERFLKGYFGQYGGLYFTGDGAYQDSNGDYWITGRVDDVINVAGHRLGTAEIESALVKHQAVAEAAVIGVPHPVKGESVYAFVSLVAGKQWSPKLIPELQQMVTDSIGKLAMPEQIEYVNKLPKTRSGKIMRRLLRNVVTGEFDKIGDISTLAEPEVLDQLKAAHAKGKIQQGGSK
ncbi:MAG: acetate--CoA ligase [Proteobacteria bacterium]|nr:acetate--CoA ligase [Pseudomonadota bacterium]